MPIVESIEELVPGLVAGPAMLRLTDKQRRFVLAMASDPFGNAKEWAKAAGYSDRSGAAKVSGHRVLHDPRVELAVAEVARSLMFRDAPLLAVSGLLRIAKNSRHPKQLRALETLANRVGLHELTEGRVVVEHRSESTEALVLRVRELAGRLGMDAEKLLGGNARDVTPGAKAEPKVIEHAPQAHRHRPADKGKAG